MTAIAGYWSFDDRPDSKARCERMLEAQRIYGPDAPAIAADGALAMGRRLFEPAPDDRGGRTVTRAADSGALLVADLRLDNRDELCDALGLGSAAGSDLTDSDLLLRALERWQEGAIDRIDGDFAFAYWAPSRRRLLLVRDMLGEKPLHYATRPRFFAFSSMAKGLHALPEVPMAPDESAVAGFVALLPEDGSDTFFRGVEKVRSGHFVAVTHDGVRSERWWRPRLTPVRLGGHGEYAEAMRAHFDRAVAVRLRGSGGHVAAHLSAGLDSSTVAATAARLLAPAGGRVTAFTAVPREGFEGRGHPETIVDESGHAESVAAMHANIDHVIVRNGGSPLAALDRDFLLYERPTLNLCNTVWLNKILDLARDRRLAVLLTGTRGNMSISYDGMPLLTQLLASGRLLALLRESAALRRNGTRLGTIGAQALGPFIPAPLWRGIGRLRGRSRKITDYSAIDAGAVERLGLAERAAERGVDFSHRPRGDPVETRLWVLRRVDMGNYNKGTLAGWGIDPRDPTADRRLIEFCLAVPPGQFLRHGTSRALARTAFADRLPQSILQERRKGYQAADWHEGLSAARGELGEELKRIAECAEARSILDTDRLQRMTADWPARAWDGVAAMQNYRQALLRGVSAGHFLRRASGPKA
ncbi:MAG TPA: asparagine synthase-related protein [Allosphingosinicella sp.]|jgi:asparagine synthase (glutamine-hydrolysing)